MLIHIQAHISREQQCNSCLSIFQSISWPSSKPFDHFVCIPPMYRGVAYLQLQNTILFCKELHLKTFAKFSSVKNCFHHTVCVLYRNMCVWVCLGVYISTMYDHAVTVYEGLRFCLFYMELAYLLLLFPMLSIQYVISVFIHDIP